jgi:hypothetical protein
MATINLGRIKPVFRGAYAGGTAYVVDDIVTSGGECFICILASTGNATSNATYWTKLAEKGADGALGTNPQLSMTWDNATADADNGAGKIAWNHATIASATILYIDDADDGSANIQPYVITWDDITNTTAKGIVTITKESTPATFATFKVSGTITDASGYSKVPVTHLVSNGSFSDADGVGVHFQYSGTDGTVAWQTVITADPSNAVAGRGYFCNTTAGAFAVTLPTSATIGDKISFIDYAATFDTNNLTVGRNSHKIQGASSDLTVATERAAFSLVYVDATHGWLLTEK